MEKKIRISVIIPTYNHFEDALKPCLESLIKKTSFDREDVKFEIIVVANGCNEPTEKGTFDKTKVYMQDLLREDHFEMLWFDEPLGYTKAINEGISVATGDYIVLLNNDVKFLDYGRKDEWWEVLLKPFQEDEKVGITGPHRLVCNASHRSFLVFFLVMTTRELLEKFKVKDGEYLDEIFNPGGGEDTDYCIKLTDAGYKCVRVPQELENPFDQRNTTEFTYPVFHTAEATVHGDVDWTQFGEESWKQIFYDHWKILKERFLIDPETEAKFRSQNEAVYNEVIEWNLYQLFEHKISGRDVLDVGGFYGYFSYLCSKLRANRIVTVEADPENYKILTGNLKGIDRISWMNLVAEKEDGKRFTTENEGPCTKIKEKLDGNLSSVSFSKLVAGFNGTKNVLKVDIEGSEVNFLGGAKTEELRKFERIFIEVHSKNLKDEIEFLFESKGFKKVAENQLTEFNADGSVNRPLEVWPQEWERIDEWNENLWKAKKRHDKFVEDSKIEVTATISTKNRYHSTLPLAMTAIATQTYKPKKLIVYDDGDHLDLRKDPLYQNILNLFGKKGIDLWVEFAAGKGQVLNHQKAVMHDATTEWVWRLDDDNIPEDDCLEKLVKNIRPDVGAVAGLVLDPKADNRHNPEASNKIEDYWRMLNEQWFHFPDGQTEAKEVDHLYSTFIYRVEAGRKHGYCMELSKVGHGEETLFTHNIRRSGYKLLIDPKAITWHFHYPQGGIRSPEMQKEMWEQDSQIISRHFKQWDLENKGVKIIVLDNGIGDHYAFKNIIEDVKKKYSDKELNLAVCYPEVFADVKDIALMSIGQAQQIYGGLDQFSVYKWMADHQWKKSIVEAYKEMYL